MQQYTLKMINKELSRARRKFPLWPRDIIHAAAIVAEESGELTRATVRHVYEQGSLDSCLVEAVHTATTAIRFIEAYTDFNQGYNKPHFTRSYDK